MKRTITLLSLLTLMTAATMSCKKDTITNTVYVADNSTLGLLTEKQWHFDTLYSGYTGPGTGTLAYARGGTGNTINNDNIRDMYWKDGHADYFDNSGAYQSDSYSFNGIDSVNLTLLSPGGTIHGRILKLDATHYNFYDSTNHTLDIQVYKP